MNLAELITTPDGAGDCDAAEIPMLLLELAALQSTLTARLVAARREGDDDMLDIATAAKRLGMSTHFLYKHVDEYPFTIRLGQGRRTLRFSARGIEKFLAQRKRLVA